MPKIQKWEGTWEEDNTRRGPADRVLGGDDGGRQEGLVAGGAKQDPGHSHNGDPRWSQQREELWWKEGLMTPGGQQVVE